MKDDSPKTEKPGNSADKPEHKPEPPKEVVRQTRHAIQLDGRKLEYTATAGNLVLKEEDGKPRASFFFVAYTTQNAADPARRPITFAFNGGPGSSSVWLHLGAFGPKRVEMTDEGDAPPPPYQLVQNEATLLDRTDLVFVDPVTTGYSRAAPGEDAKKFHGYKEDLESVGEFIRLYTTRAGRWASPKFLAGESYGTTRAAALAEHLQTRHGIFFNGVVLVSCVLSFQTLIFGGSNDLPPILYLPAYAATAFYHRKLEPELQRDLRATLSEVEHFALTDYTLALMRGSSLPPEQRAPLAARLARYTGLSPRYVEQTDLRIDILRFAKELLRDEGRTVGRLDSRLTGVDRDSAGEHFEYDPSYAAIRGPFTAAFNHLVRGELRYESDLPYEILTDRVHPWSFKDFENRYVDVADNLRQAMTHNAALKVFVGNGYYDLATPYFATEYTFTHLGSAQLQERVRMGHYEAGHMMYIKKSCREQLKTDLASFYEWAAPASS